MHHVTIATGVILCAIGLFGYFGSASESPSPTALIPAGFGAVFIVLGIVAHKASVRMHAMHAAAALGLIGFILAGGRGFMKIGLAASDDLTISRPVRLVILMALVCLIYVCMCVWSFISARRRRSQTTA
jgi:low temperature requirement protein LtrA